MDPDEIRELFAYNDWANDRSIAAIRAVAAADLTRPLVSSFSSILATLAHLASTEWVWFERWQGRAPAAPPAWMHGTLDDICGGLQEVRTRRAGALVALTPDELRRVATWHSMRGDVSWTVPIATMLRHVVNHSTYHRGQLATLLRQVGATPASVDLITFAGERSRA